MQCIRKQMLNLKSQLLAVAGTYKKVVGNSFKINLFKWKYLIYIIMICGTGFASTYLPAYRFVLKQVDENKNRRREIKEEWL
jgi:hypothetical protein